MADKSPLREARSNIVALAVVLYAVQRSTVGLPAELLMAAEQLYFILEVYSAYPSIGLPAAVVIPGLLIFADDQVNSWLLEGVILSLDLKVLVFVCLSTVLYFNRPSLLKQVYPQAAISLGKGLNSARGSNKLAAKVLYYGPSLASFKLLYAVLFIKLASPSFVKYVYNVITGRATKFRAEVRALVIKVIVLTTLATTMHHLAIDFRLVCDGLFLWWQVEKTLHS
jgi:hypothetical protein